MPAKSIFFAMAMGTWTAAALGGSIFLIFNNPLTAALAEQPNLHLSIYAQGLLILLGLAIIFGIAAAGGGLWGAGVALMMSHEPRPLVRTGALYWGGSVLLGGLVLYFSQIPIAAVDRAISLTPYDLHYLFTLVFVPVVGLAAMVTVRNMVGKLGLAQLKKGVGRNSDRAAAAAFLVVSLALLFGWGWEVAGPYAGRRYSMILIMHVCNFASAFAGGLAMGWTLVRARCL